MHSDNFHEKHVVLQTYQDVLALLFDYGPGTALEFVRQVLDKEFEERDGKVLLDEDKSPAAKLLQVYSLLVCAQFYKDNFDPVLEWVKTSIPELVWPIGCERFSLTFHRLRSM